jgi:hypothetical protein
VTWVGTGNNIKLAGDLPRRTVWVRLDAKQARPWLRDTTQFRHPNLIEWVREHRGDVIRAILIVARAWVVAGRPPADVPVLGGYESWCRVLGGILGFMREPGFLSNLEALYAQADSETPQWEAFLVAWRETLGDRPVSVAELVSYLNDNSDLAAFLPDNIGDRGEKGFTRKVGKALAKREGVRFPNGSSVVKGTVSRGLARWMVSYESLESGNTPQNTNDGVFGVFQTTPARIREMDLFSHADGAETNTPNTPNTPLEDDEK